MCFSLRLCSRTEYILFGPGDLNGLNLFIAHLIASTNVMEYSLPVNYFSRPSSAYPSLVPVESSKVSNSELVHEPSIFGSALGKKAVVAKIFLCFFDNFYITTEASPRISVGSAQVLLVVA